MKTSRGFTLLEVVVALAILSMALMAIFDLNAGALASHAYTKRLTVATLLARSKMTDLEQKLYDEPLPTTDQEEDGDFSEEGWPNFKWRARILAPKTTNVSTDKVIGALFGVPTEGSDLSEITQLLAGGAGGDKGGGEAAGMAGAAGGMMSGLIQGQLTQMIEQLGQTVREVHLTVSWKDGTRTETIDLVTHVASLGQGSDRQSVATGSAAGAGGGSNPSGWMNPRTGRIVPNAQMINGAMRDPADPSAVLVPIPSTGQMQLGPGAPGGGLPGGVSPNPSPPWRGNRGGDTR